MLQIVTTRLAKSAVKSGTREREPNGEIIGATLESYLLERSQITEHAEGERGYHIFYQLAAGMLQSDMPDRSARLEPYYRKVWEKLEPQRELAKAVLCSEEWIKDLREDEHKQRQQHRNSRCIDQEDQGWLEHGVDLLDGECRSAAGWYLADEL